MYNRYQALFSEQTNFKDELVKIFHETIISVTEIDIELVKESISIEYVKELNGKWVVGFNFYYDEEIQDIILNISDLLKSNDKIICFIKYLEERLFNILNNYYKQIFYLEMKLREIMTLIFAEKYHHCLFDFFNEVEIQPFYKDKRLLKNKEYRESFLKERLENEFFYLIFSNYITALKQKNLSPDIIFNIIHISSNFNEFKDYILNRGITIKEHQDFLSSIKDHLNNIEIVRNCVAHNRTPTDDEIYNYELSINELNDKLDNFLNILKQETLSKYKRLL